MKIVLCGKWPWIKFTIHLCFVTRWGCCASPRQAGTSTRRLQYCWKRVSIRNLSGNEVSCTNALLSLIKIMLCRKLRSQKVLDRNSCPSRSLTLLWSIWSQQFASQRRAGMPTHRFYLAQCIYSVVSETQLPHKTVNLVIVKKKSTILCWSWLLKYNWWTHYVRYGYDLQLCCGLFGSTNLMRPGSSLLQGWRVCKANSSSHLENGRSVRVRQE